MKILFSLKKLSWINFKYKIIILNRLIGFLKMRKIWNFKFHKWTKWCRQEEAIYIFQTIKAAWLKRGNHNWIQANKSSNAWKWISKRKENCWQKVKIKGTPTWRSFMISLHRKCTVIWFNCRRLKILICKFIFIKIKNQYE